MLSFQTENVEENRTVKDVGSPRKIDLEIQRSKIVDVDRINMDILRFSSY